MEIKTETGVMGINNTWRRKGRIECTARPHKADNETCKAVLSLMPAIKRIPEPVSNCDAVNKIKINTAIIA
jgi:hypothetical protein